MNKNQEIERLRLEKELLEMKLQKTKEEKPFIEINPIAGHRVEYTFVAKKEIPEFVKDMVAQALIDSNNGKVEQSPRILESEVNRFWEKYLNSTKTADAYEEYAKRLSETPEFVKYTIQMPIDGIHKRLLDDATYYLVVTPEQMEKIKNDPRFK